MPYDLESLKRGIIAADKSGDSESVKALGAEYRKLQGQSQPQAPAKPATSEDIPGFIPQPTPSPKPSIGEQIVGAGEAGLSVLTGMAGLPAGLVSGTAQGLLGGKYGIPKSDKNAENRAADIASSLTYQPRTEAGKADVESIDNVVRESGIAGLSLMPIGELAGGIKKPPEGSIRSGVENVKSAVTPQLDAEKVRLGQKAVQLGIPIRPDMLMNNRIVKYLGDTLESVPLSGDMATHRQEAWNNAIADSIGVQEHTGKITPDVFDTAMKRSGGGIGEISRNTNIPLSDDFKNKLNSHATEAMKFETPEVSKIVSNYVKEINSKAEKGVISGEAFRKIRTKLTGQMRRTSDGDLKHALDILDDDLLDALQSRLSPDDLKMFNEYRRQYAVGKIIEPLVAKSSTGDISTSSLMGRVTATASGKSAMARGYAGEIGDLARIGQALLKDMPSSGTAERGLTYSALGGGAVAAPHVAAGVLGAANLYNRLGPSISRRIVGDEIPLPPQ